MGYRGAAVHSLREIGQALGIANILEGSVRREGNRVVVTVQLIDALTDRHLWANRYDRTLADSLGLQGELAAEIAEALRVTLSPDEKARVETKPTENSEAYVFYLRANQIARNPDTMLEDFKKAEQFYIQAITLDPNFAAAHARLASTRAAIYHFFEPLDSLKSKARAEAELALRLQQNLAEAYLALGQCNYWIDQDYERALAEFGAAAALAPSDGEVGGLIASIKRRQGKWQESLETFEKIKSSIRKIRTLSAIFFLPIPLFGAGRKRLVGQRKCERWRPLHSSPKFKAVMSSFGGRATRARSNQCSARCRPERIPMA